MTMTRILVALALLSACGSEESEPIVTEPVRHSETELARAGDDLEGSAIEYVRNGIGLPDDEELVLIAIRRGTDGLRHARLQQVTRGVPVFGSEIIAHADDSTFLGYGGLVTRNLAGFDVAPTVTGDEAAAIAANDHAGGAVTYQREEIELVILPRAGGGADLAWVIDRYNKRQGSVEAARWNYFIDARSGEVIDKFNGLHTVEQASGPGGNGKVSRTWDAELDVEPDGSEYKMETDRLVTVDRQDSDMVIKGPLDNLDDAAANDAHGFAEITLAMMSEWMGQNSLDGNGFVIRSRVHDTDYCSGAPENACWNGTEMTYGDGASYFYPLSGAIDVVAHELNHGFTSFHSNLVYAGMSGGLNESFSDIAGTLAEFYDEGDAGDWSIGEDVIMAAGGILRDMCNPNIDGSSLNDTSGYDERMDPHYTSGVPNRAFCLTVGRLVAAGAAGTATPAMAQRLGQVWYAANAGYWTSTASFNQACLGTIDAARALGFSDQEVTELTQSWADVGVACDGGTLICDNDATCDPGDGETCASCSADCGSCAEVCNAYKRAKCEEGIGDCSGCSMAACGDGVCDNDEDDETCGQDCGCAAPRSEASDHCGQVSPFGCWCDADCANTLPDPDCCADKEMVCGP